MRTVVPALFLAAVIALLSPALQSSLREWLGRRRSRVFLGPVVLSLAFCAVVWRLDALTPPLALLIAAYTLLPVICAFLGGARLDPVVILLLWLPLEFNLGERWIPKAVQGFVHTVGYGIAIALALWVFLLFRNLPGMKFNPPTRGKDLGHPLLAFIAVAPVLIGLGLLTGFLDPLHAPKQGSLLSWGWRFTLIFLATALPEEILFRSLIQNWLMLRFGASLKTLLLAGIVFGSAHLNNGPGPPPNWRYLALATVAGVTYGWVFQKSSSVLSSALLHAMVNMVRHVFF